MILVCKKCNRVKIGDAEWSNGPSSKMTPDSKGAEGVDQCPHCEGKTEEPPKPDPKPKKNAEPKAKDKKSAKEEPAVPVKTEVVSGPVDQAGKANENHQIILSSKKLMGEALIGFAHALRASFEEGYYKFYADSWEEYLSAPEIGIDRTRASRLLNFSRFCVAYEKKRGKLPDVLNLAEGRICRHLVPCMDIDKKSLEIKNIDDMDDLISKAQTLGNDDLDTECKEYRNAKGSGPDDTIYEKRIDEGPIKDTDGNVIGYINGVFANEKAHTLKVKIMNEYIQDDKMTIIIP